MSPMPEARKVAQGDHAADGARFLGAGMRDSPGAAGGRSLLEISRGKASMTMRGSMDLAEMVMS